MNDEELKKIKEEHLPKLQARVATLENERECVEELRKDYPGLEARVTALEKKQDVIDNVKNRVDKVEIDIGIIKQETKQMGLDIKDIAVKVDVFSNKIRTELNRFICWVAGIIVVSLCSGLVVMFIYQGKMFQGMGIKIGSVEKEVTERIHHVETDVLKLGIKVDTIGRE